MNLQGFITIDSGKIGMDSDATQEELFVPLSLTTVTTMFGYIGIAFSSHPGLQTIGILACIDLFCTWFTSLFLLPSLLDLMRRISKKRKTRELKRLQNEAREALNPHKKNQW